MLSGDGYKSSLRTTISRSDSSDEENNFKSKHNTSHNIPNGADIESSGVFVAGYTGPIHKWEHPGYQFLTESAQGKKIFYLNFMRVCSALIK